MNPSGVSGEEILPCRCGDNVHPGGLLGVSWGGSVKSSHNLKTQSNEAFPGLSLIPCVLLEVGIMSLLSGGRGQFETR